MTTATVAPPSGTAYAVLLAMTLLIGFIYGAILWQREGVMDRHDDELADQDQRIGRQEYRLDALLEHLGLEIPEPADDDSPEAEARTYEFEGNAAAEDDTEEFDAVPDTEPSGIAAQVHAALIERPVPDTSSEHPHPVDSEARKAQRAADIEERLKQFTFTGRGK